MNQEGYTFEAKIKRKTFWSTRKITVKDCKLSYHKIGNDQDKKVFYLDSLRFSTRIDSKNKEYVFCFYKEGKINS